MQLEGMENVMQSVLSKIGKKNITLLQEQYQAISSVFSGQDTIVCLPTGRGKSIIFEAVPWCHAFANGNGDCRGIDSVVLIISPLLSLMTKQVGDLTKRGLSAVRLSNDLSPVTKETVAKAEVMYIFVSPEIVQERRWRELLLTSEYQAKLRAVFVDEAHCVEMWGGGSDPFRSSYRQLGDLRSFLPVSVPFCALTATTSTSTRKYIADSLGLDNPKTISISPNRINTMYHIVRIADIQCFKWVIEELRVKRNNASKKVIYCQSIAACAQLYTLFDMSLKDSGYVGSDRKASTCLFAMYHAKVTDAQKVSILDSFSVANGCCRVLFSTIAFGMGVNIPDIRMIIHFGPSQSIEAYVQECGRGGRDGLECHAILCTFPGCTRGQIREEMKTYCQNDDSVCRRQVLFSHFPGEFSSPAILHKCCDVCRVLCRCNCTCNSCTCGRGSPCQECCTCINQCTYVDPLTGFTKKPEAEQEPDFVGFSKTLAWDEENSFHDL